MGAANSSEIPEQKSAGAASPRQVPEQESKGVASPPKKPQQESVGVVSSREIPKQESKAAAPPPKKPQQESIRVASPPKTPKQESMNDFTFLALQHSSITYKELLSIESRGLDGWFRDSTMGMALEIMALYYQCDRNRIALVNPFSARIIFKIGLDGGDGDENRALLYRTELDLVKDADFVLIPINDGYAIEDHSAKTAGTHWALLVVDCRKPGVEASYFDSGIRPYSSKMEAVARRCTEGIYHLLKICGRKITTWSPPITDPDTPNQYTYNKCKDDVGACGPFVLHFASKIIVYIRSSHQKCNFEKVSDSDALLVKSDFCISFVNFERPPLDSRRFRKALMDKIVEQQQMLYETTHGSK
ncbi:cysteine proteinase [Polyplosphaeria fusca]|uniref:Cysteine proteinase n=1 Tax=Polyplosphaeria fusca TaxID=682080 RepID=A0A9P4R8S1_9PLEO|nr:cysteine proteinase [Polyplosphaeria fusca]